MSKDDLRRIAHIANGGNMVNLKVEWVCEYHMLEAPADPERTFDPDADVPVVRLEALRQWLEERLCLDTLLDELNKFKEES